MVSRKRKKTALEYAVSTGLADYLRSVGDVPVAANARAAAMRERARECWESRNSRRVERNQVFRFSVYTVHFVLLCITPLAAWPNEVCRWAKLQLPSGQKARSVWYESSVNTKLHQASCVEVSYFYVLKGILLLKCIMQIKQEGGTCIANVQFYFYIRFGNVRHPLAMVLMLSLPDADVFTESSETVYLSEPLSTQDRIVVIPCYDSPSGPLGM